MKFRRKKDKIKKKNTYYGFGIVSVIVIIVITALISAMVTGVIVMNNYKSFNVKNINLAKDKNMQEFIELYSTVLSKYYDEVDSEKMIKAAEEGMISYLGDKYTKFLSDTEYNSLIDGLKSKYEGIGVAIINNIIQSVTPGSPAEKAGLMVGDIIISINNKNVETMNSEEISGLIKDSESKTVSLVIKRSDAIANFTVKKSKIELPYAEGNMIDNTTIGYLDISAFSESLPKQVESELIKLEQSNMTGLVIDLRNNGGGYLNSVKDTASLFLKKGETIFSLKSIAGKKVVKDETDENRSYPIVILINKQTASAAEILAVTLKQNSNATLVGNNSYGKGKVQQISSLSNGDTVKYTTAEWLAPDDTCIDGSGLLADVNVDITYKYDNEGKIIGLEDTQYTKAIELLS